MCSGMVLHHDTIPWYYTTVLNHIKFRIRSVLPSSNTKIESNGDSYTHTNQMLLQKNGTNQNGSS